MRLKAYLLILALICLLLVSFACATTDDNIKAERELTQRLWQSLMDYNFELATAEQIYKETLNHASDLLTAGEINTRELRGREYQATLIYANTIKFLDSKPRYTELNIWLWRGIGDGKPPELAHSMPEFEVDKEQAEIQYEQYLQDYIESHLSVVDEFCEYLKAKADELNLELTYEPTL
jgi:hypothetical protein